MSDIFFKELCGENGDIGKIILNRPQKLNALNLDMCKSINQQLQIWSQKKSIKAVIISGEGERAFCAGGDVLSLYEHCRQQQFDQVDEFFKEEYTMNQTIFEFNKPYLAFLDGMTFGGGVGLSIHGSFPLATDRLVWAMPETAIGFFPDVGVCYHLSQFPRHIGNYLALTGEKLNAESAYILGIVKAIIPHICLIELEKLLLETPFSGNDFNKVKQLIGQFHQPNTEFYHVPHIKLIEKIFSGESVDEIVYRCSLEQAQWSRQLMIKLKNLSPLSLKITLKHLRHCRNYDFKQVMAENLILAQHFIRDHNFIEGIRAALVDKDRQPQWRPNSIENIHLDLVQSFFLKPDSN